MMKKKRSKWNSTRLFNIHKNVFVFLNMVIWFNMFLVIKVMNPDISFSFFEGFVANSMTVAMVLMIALVIHYIVHNRYLASKWQQYEQQQHAYHSDAQTEDENTYQRDFSHLKERYEDVDNEYPDEPVELKNGNKI